MFEMHQFEEHKCIEVKDYNNAAYHYARAGVIGDFIIKAKMCANGWVYEILIYGYGKKTNNIRITEV